MDPSKVTGAAVPPFAFAFKAWPCIVTAMVSRLGGLDVPSG